MAYPHNPQLSFKPGQVDHYVAFDSNSVTNQNDYMIYFDQAYRNVVAISLESAHLPYNNNETLSLKLNDIDNIQAGGVMNANGSIDCKSYLDNTFALFHFDHDVSTKQHFQSSDIIPNVKELKSPIGRLGQLHLVWNTENGGEAFNNTSRHVLVFKITTVS